MKSLKINKVQSASKTTQHHAKFTKYINNIKAQVNLINKHDILSKYHLKNYIIAIPSYKRPDIIQTKTLKLLQQHNINSNIINIFVADQTEYDNYKTQIPATLYGELIIGELGLKNQRNFISNYYPIGTHIVQMDDDVEKIVELQTNGATKSGRKSTKSIHILNKQLQTHKHSQLKPNKKTNKVKPISNLDMFIKQAFALCTATGAFLWGVYPLANPYFMTNTITTDLRFIVGPFWGMINRHDEHFTLTIDEKENTQRTLQFYTHDGLVIRFNNVGIQTKYYRNRGGMQQNADSRFAAANKSAHILHAIYPTLTRVIYRAKTGFPEVKLLKSAKMK